MNRIIVYSSQPPNEKKLPLISIEEIKNRGEPLVLVVVKENARENMEKLAKDFGVKSPVNSVYYRDNMQEKSDERYVLKNVFIPFRMKNVFAGFFGGALVMA